MRTSNASWIAAFLVAATTAVALWAWMSLPAGAGVPVNVLTLEGVRVHGSSRMALWLIPFVSAMVMVGLTFGPRLHRGVEAAALPFEMTLIAVTGVLLVTEIALVGRAVDPQFNVMRPVAIATGVLLLAVGNYLGKARQNAIFGVKTPWTLADAQVWDKTHRFTGRGMVLGGLVLIVLGFLLHNGTALGLSIGACTALPVLVGAARSWSLYRDLQRS